MNETRGGSVPSRRLPTAKAGPAPSVRRRSLVWTTLLLTMLGLVAAGVAYAIDLAEADRLLDGQLQQIAFYAGPGLSQRSPRSRIYDRNHDVLIQVRDPAGAMLYSSDPGLALPPQAADGFAAFQFDGESWNTFRMAERGTTVQVSQRTSLRRRQARIAALEAAIPVLATIPLGWLVVGWGLGQMQTSLSRLAGVIAARGVESRTPVDLEGVPVEFGALVEAMNALIERWRLSLEQQKRFLSDAAHELRSPLTALRLQIDLLQPDGRGACSLAAALPELVRGAGRASALVDQLLRMARYDANENRVEQRDIDLVPLVLGCMADVVILAESKEIDLGLVASDPARLRGGERDLNLLVANLIENAVRYTPKGGTVDIAVRLDGGSAIVDVADTGCGIPEDVLPRVFDRFFRAPGLEAEGSGLGLAIGLAIARRHGLSLTLRNRAGGGILATVSGPAVTSGTKAPCSSERPEPSSGPTSRRAAEAANTHLTGPA